MILAHFGCRVMQMSPGDVKDHIADQNSHAISPFRWPPLIRFNSALKLSQLNAIYSHLKSPYIDNRYYELHCAKFYVYVNGWWISFKQLYRHWHCTFIFLEL